MNTDMLIPEVPDEDCGEKLKACTQSERRFVLAVLEIGAGKWTRAAAMAGYKGDTHVLSVTGTRVSQRPRVQEALLEVAGQSLGRAAAHAAGTVLDIMDDDKADKKTRLRAAGMVLDRVGLAGKTEHNVNVTHEVGDRAAMLKVLQMKVAANPALFASLPEPVQKLLSGSQPKVIDAEFNIVGGDEEIDWSAVDVTK